MAYNGFAGGFVQGLDELGLHEGEVVAEGGVGDDDMECVAVNPAAHGHAVDGRADNLRPHRANLLALDVLGLSGLLEGEANYFAHRQRLVAFHWAELSERDSKTPSVTCQSECCEGMWLTMSSRWRRWWSCGSRSP